MIDSLIESCERIVLTIILLLTGLVHPLIHLGFGLEFNQPAIVAEALAQAAVHDDKLGYDFFLSAEKKTGAVGKASSKSLIQLLNEILENEALATSAQFGDKNKITDGVLRRASQEMLHVASQYTVSEDQVDEKLAEMINAVGKWPTVYGDLQRVAFWQCLKPNSIQCIIRVPPSGQTKWSSWTSFSSTVSTRLFSSRVSSIDPV